MSNLPGISTLSGSPSISAYGRKWELQVLTAPDVQGNSQTIKVAGGTFEPTSLKIRFDIWQPGYKAFWYGDIEIFNFDVGTAGIILQQGMTVKLLAGYENGNQQNGLYGQIFIGKLFQAYVEREDSVNFKTTLHCIVGMPELVANVINMSRGGPITQANAADAAIALAAKQAANLSLKYLAGTVSGKTLPRGKVYFGDPQAYLDQVADDNDLLWWYDGTTVNMANFNNPDPNAIEYTPTTGIVATPQQTEQGIALRVLLDPRLRVKINPVQVKIDMSSIRYRKQLIGEQPSMLDQDGVYVVGSVRHTGDSRDNTWYTDILGYTTVGGKVGFLGVSVQSIVDGAVNEYQQPQITGP